MCLCVRMLAFEWKGRAFIDKGNSRCFFWFPAAILVDSLWRLSTKLYEGAWNVSANNSEIVDHKDLAFGRIIYILVFYNIHFLGFLHWTVSNLFFCAVFIAWQWKRRIKHLHSDKVNYCWFARDVTAAMLVVKNKSISLLWELNSTFM